jgi:hypothetical protein
MIKSRFYAFRNENNNLSIEESLSILLTGIDFSYECLGFYRNMRRWIDKARLRELFIYTKTYVYIIVLICFFIFFMFIDITNQ